MKTIKWTSQKGNEIELRAEYESSLVKEMLNADGDQWESGKMVKEVAANLELYTDGKKIDSCWDVTFWRIINLTGTPYKRIWGIDKMAMTAEQAELVEEFLKSVIAEGEDEEVKENEKKEAAKEKDEKIAEAKETIAKTEAQKTIPTAAEYKKWRIAYNNLYNEGGEGYIPTLITKEEYDYAKSIVK